MYKMTLTIACLAIDGAYCAAVAWLWSWISSAQGVSLLDVNIEGEECARWILDGDTILLLSLVGGRWLGVLELALQLLFGQKEIAHLLGTSQDLLLSFLEVYFWSRWTKGSRGSSMEDILELGSLCCSLQFLGWIITLYAWWFCWDLEDGTVEHQAFKQQCSLPWRFWDERAGAHHILKHIFLIYCNTLYRVVSSILHSSWCKRQLMKGKEMMGIFFCLISKTALLVLSCHSPCSGWNITESLLGSLHMH